MTTDPAEQGSVQQGDGLVGRVLGETYLLEQLLGQGGMGAVYAGRHLATRERSAIKVLYPEAAANAQIYRRFQDEARITSALRHPHIVQVLDFQVDQGRLPFLVMELLEGEDLQQRLFRVGRMPLPPVLEMAQQIGGALQAAHNQGVIHRDIKPQNIFLSQKRTFGGSPSWGEGEVAKVLDFGISKIRHAASQHTRDMTLLGTPQFMSPEAALGQNSQLDGRADQWGLAVIVYCALSSLPPFDGENMMGVLYQVVNQHPTPLSQLCPGLPVHVVAAVERAMAKRKEDRFAQVTDFVKALSGERTGPGVLEVDVTRSAWLPRTPLRIPSVPLAEDALLDSELTRYMVTPPPVEREPQRSRSTISQAAGQVDVTPPWRNRRRMLMLCGGLMGTGLAATLLLLGPQQKVQGIPTMPAQGAAVVRPRPDPAPEPPREVITAATTPEGAPSSKAIAEHRKRHAAKGHGGRHSGHR